VGKKGQKWKKLYEIIHRTIYINESGVYADGMNDNKMVEKIFSENNDDTVLTTKG
jgi:hypothetical protein